MLPYDVPLRSALTTAVLALVLGVAACAVPAPVTSTPVPSPSVMESDPPPSAHSTPTPAPTAAPSDPGGPHVAAGLALVRAPDAQSPRTEIFVVEAEGTQRQVSGLGGETTGAAGPVWSPDGRIIGFGPSILASGIFPAMIVVNADGTGQRLIKQLDVEEFSRAAWSSDGRFILYSDATPPGDRRIWLTDLSNGETARIGTGSHPRWLNGDRQISFSNGVAGRVPGQAQALTMVVFVMDREDLVPLEFAEADNANWAPDGAAVLIETEGILILADANGSGGRVVAHGGQAVWSPDGSRFVFQSGSDANGRALLALMDADGNELWSDVVGSLPAWSPDGTRLAVDVSHPDQMVRVLDASNGEQLWETAGAHPAWRP